MTEKKIRYGSKRMALGRTVSCLLVLVLGGQFLTGCTIWRMLTTIKNPPRSESAEDEPESKESAGELRSKESAGEPKAEKEGEASPASKASADADFGPYMAQLQKRIKRNWFPPKGQESRRVTVLFKLTADGTVKDLKLDKSSGVPAADEAAMAAVRNGSPYARLPVGAPEVVDIEFTFDYNVWSGRKKL